MGDDPWAAFADKPSDASVSSRMRLTSHSGNQSALHDDASSACNSELSEQEEDGVDDILSVRVDGEKTWVTLEDADIERVSRLSALLRIDPLLPPPLPGFASSTSATDIEGLNLPLVHCAFEGCSWVSSALPCLRCTTKSKPGIQRVENGVWCSLSPRTKLGENVYGCCGDEGCLKHHIVAHHHAAIAEACGHEALCEESYDYYCEAVAYREQLKMPSVGISIDRRTFKHVRLALQTLRSRKQTCASAAPPVAAVGAEETCSSAVSPETAEYLRVDGPTAKVAALICSCCQCVFTCTDAVHAEIGHVNAADYFNSIKDVSFQHNWCFAEYMKHYGGTMAMEDHPDLEETAWTTKRILKCSIYPNQTIICCPEDITCDAQHAKHEIRSCCQLPLCRECYFTSRNTDEVKCKIPQCLANDNFYGYVEELLLKYRVRWIECAAASPVLTCLISYYVEGDRGHLLDERMFQRTDPLVVRGNCYSFQMPWEKIVEKLHAIMEDDDGWKTLPHDELILSRMVLFNLRIGNVADLAKWLPAARLRPHVVLKMMCSLVDRKYPLCSQSRVAQQMKEKLRQQVEAKYPEREGHLREEERQGYIPEKVLEAIRRAMREPPGAATKGVRQKNATPAEAPAGMDAIIETLRPSVLLPDRDSSLIEPRDNREILALEKLSMLVARTDVSLVDQWKSEYTGLAFPFSVPRVVGGADYPLKPRFRRHRNAACLTPWEHTQMHARRVESNIKTDWNLVPSQRNLTTKWEALCGDDVACKHAVDREKAGNVLSAELIDSATKLYEKLAKGYWKDTDGKRRRINHDFTKLQYAENITDMQRDLIRDMTFLSKKIPGTQQIRLMAGHALFGACVEYGPPLFWTISPSVRHSGLCLRLSRFRRNDPYVTLKESKGHIFQPWIGKEAPSLMQQKDEEDVIIDLPAYDVRKDVSTSDPHAVMEAFKVSTKFILPRVLGHRMCPICPRCNETDAPCANKFGNNFEPWGGYAGLTAAQGFVVEYQHNNNPHAHGNAHMVSVYQHKTLEEIKSLIEKDLLDPNTIIAYQTALHREDHYDHDKHTAAVPSLEQSWKENNKAAEHDALCQLPALVMEDNSGNLWEGTTNLSDAIADAAAYSHEYKQEAQYVMSRCNHHMHLPDPKTGIRVPLSGCRSKKAKHKCKGQFPFKKKLTLMPKIICRGNARQYGLRPSGRRNALGTILTRRRCMWLSGCAPAKAIIFRCNTHTAPNFRVPPTKKTHDPDCSHDCLKRDMAKLLTAISQRAQRNTTGYYTGYMQKRQPIGAFELKQAALNLKFLEAKLRTKSNAYQYHNIANRMLGDLEFRGHVRPITEEFNLAANYHPQDVRNAEFHRTYATASFYGAGLLHRLRSEKQKLDVATTRNVRIAERRSHRRRSADTFHVSFEEAYGYRGEAHAIYYLSPWEFTGLWKREHLKPPSSYRDATPRTTWTAAGRAYWEANKEKKEAPAPKAGEHYVVIPSENPKTYISYPDEEETQDLRHNVVMVRRRRPHVPQPTATPLSTTQLAAEERCRIFSVYLRPWVLSRRCATPHVPHLADLDICVSDALAAVQPRRGTPLAAVQPSCGTQAAPGKRLRLTRKQPPPLWLSVPTSGHRYPESDHTGNPLRRSYEDAWRDYRCVQYICSLLFTNPRPLPPSPPFPPPQDYKAQSTH